MFQKPVVAFDGSEASKMALAVGIGLAKLYSVELHLVSIEEELPPYAVAKVEQEKALRYFHRLHEDARNEASRQGVVLHATMLRGHEVEAVVTFIKEQACDLLILGPVGHSSLFEQVLGGTAQTLTRVAPCSVLVVK